MKRHERITFCFFIYIILSVIRSLRSSVAVVLLMAIVLHGTVVFFILQELLGIAANRMLRMDLNTGDTLKTLRFPELKTWSVNWEIKQVRVTFESENLDFQCVTADCKVVHEFIGGYIFLSMRSGDKNQALNEELFHKLTGGWD